MIRELDVVVLKHDLPEVRLKSGDIGTVIFVYKDGTGYELEFTTFRGETVAIVTVPADAVRAIGPREIAHARAVA